MGLTNAINLALATMRATMRANSSANTNSVTGLSELADANYNQWQIQTLINKLNELITALRR